MADSDSKFMGQALQAIDYSHVIGAPAVAATEVHQAAIQNYFDNLMRAAFEKGEDGVRRPITTEFTVEEEVGGVIRRKTMRFPVMIFMPMTHLQVNEATVNLDVEVSQSAAMKENISAGGEAEGKIGYGPFSVSFKAKASYSKEQTRKTDTRAKQHVALTMGISEPPEAVSLLVETLSNMALGAASSMGLPVPEHKKLPDSEA